MQFGLFHSVQWPVGTAQYDRYQQALAQAVHAEALGFESVWMTEHHFSRHGITADSLNLLSHLAAKTERIRLGTAVSVLPFHDPIQLAESAGIVDQLSGGRLDLGIGRGNMWSEFHGFAVSHDDRARRFDEAAQVLARAWQSDAPFSHHGEFYDYDDVVVQPRPHQQPHPPIWLATAGGRGLKRCAEQGWNVMLPQGLQPDAVSEAIAGYQTELANIGATYNPDNVVLARALYVADDTETAWNEVEAAYIAFIAQARRGAATPGSNPDLNNPFDVETRKKGAVFGGPEDVIEMLREVEALGIEHIIFFVNFGDLPHERVMRSLDRFAQHVMPHFSSTANVAGV